MLRGFLKNEHALKKFMHILVTGTMGYLDSHTLIQSGHPITTLQETRPHATILNEN